MAAQDALNGSPVLLVTGGSRGIGAATCLAAAGRGYRVALSYLRDDDAAQRVVAQVERAGAEAFAVRADVSSEDDVLALFAAVDRRYGSLTHLVNNVGVVAARGRLDSMDAARLRRMFEVNVVGALLVAREAIRRMSPAHGGHGGAIVSVSSQSARTGAPGYYVDYAASKAAVDGFTVGLAKEVLGEGIRVNCVRPGIIDTEIHGDAGYPDRVAELGPTLPFGRAGRAEEVAAAILWLLSDEASYVTGALLDVPGVR